MTTASSSANSSLDRRPLIQPQLQTPKFSEPATQGQKIGLLSLPNEVLEQVWQNLSHSELLTLRKTQGRLRSVVDTVLTSDVFCDTYASKIGERAYRYSEKTWKPEVRHDVWRFAGSSIAGRLSLTEEGSLGARVAARARHLDVGFADHADVRSWFSALHGFYGGIESLKIHNLHPGYYNADLGRDVLTRPAATPAIPWASLSALEMPRNVLPMFQSLKAGPLHLDQVRGLSLHIDNVWQIDALAQPDGATASTYDRTQPADSTECAQAARTLGTCLGTGGQLVTLQITFDVNGVSQGLGGWELKMLSFLRPLLQEKDAVVQEIALSFTASGPQADRKVIDALRTALRYMLIVPPQGTEISAQIIARNAPKLKALYLTCPDVFKKPHTVCKYDDVPHPIESLLGQVNRYLPTKLKTLKPVEFIEVASQPHQPSSLVDGMGRLALSPVQPSQTASRIEATAQVIPASAPARRKAVRRAVTIALLSAATAAAVAASASPGAASLADLVLSRRTATMQKISNEAEPLYFDHRGEPIKFEREKRPLDPNFM